MRDAPLILIVPSINPKGIEFSDNSLSLSERYTAGIVAAGGVPWVLPRITETELNAECVRRCDGVLLTGGDDINPKLYGAEMTPELEKTVELADPERDHQELILIDEIFRQHKPLLAICRGHQILNVALGGTLIVDIPLQVPDAKNHQRSDRKGEIVDEAALTPDSDLAKITGTQTLGINSSHHQAVGRVAELLRPTGVSSDGIIEALELKPEKRDMLPYLISIQAHPERLFDRYPQHMEIFRSFIRASGARKKESA